MVASRLADDVAVGAKGWVITQDLHTLGRAKASGSSSTDPLLWHLECLHHFLSTVETPPPLGGTQAFSALSFVAIFQNSLLRGLLMLLPGKTVSHGFALFSSPARLLLFSCVFSSNLFPPTVLL